jgi:hypothetical protein
VSLVKSRGERLTVQNEVELESVWLGPILVSRINEVVGTKLLSVLFLIFGVGDCEHLCTESVCPHESEVAQASDSDDADLLARTTTETDEGRVGRESSAQHRSGNGGVEILGNLEHEILLYSNMGREATLGDSTILVLGAVGIDPGDAC